MIINQGKPNVKDVHINIDKELYDRLVELSEIDDRSISSTVKRIVVNYMDDYEKTIRNIKYTKTEEKI